MRQLSFRRYLPAQNARASELLERFLIFSVSTIIITRLLLGLTGYPQLGGGGFHIAHVLWGGLLMLLALLITFVFAGRGVHEAAAIVGGVGFGLFIDEVGKFVTSQNDYFFRPSFAIMYGAFALLLILLRYESSRPVPVADNPPEVWQKFLTVRVAQVILAIFCATVVFKFVVDLAGLTPTGGVGVFGDLLADAAAVIFMLRGITLYYMRRISPALHALWVAVAISILLVQFFDFYQEQLIAVLYVFINLAAYVAIERLLKKVSHQKNVRSQ